MALIIYYGDILNGDSLSIKRSISGGRELPEDITLELDDSAGTYISYIKNGEEIRGKRIKMKVDGDEDDPRFNTLLYPAVTGWRSKPPIFYLTLKTIEPDAWQSNFPNEVYDPTASPWVDSVNGTTITAPDFDKGKAFALPFGHAKKVPFVYVQKDTDNDYYDYVCIGPCEADTGDEHSVKCYVYRNGRLVDNDPVLYTIYSGGPTDPYPGYFTIRFHAEQRDVSGNNYEITADIYGLTMGTSNAQRNFAQVIKNCLSNTTWGKSLSVDEGSFVTSAAILNAISDGASTYPLYCDGYLAEQRNFQDIIDDLCFCARSFIREDLVSGGVLRIVTDEYETTPDAYFGIGDDLGYENVLKGSFEEEGISSDNATRSLTVKYRPNTWTGEYTDNLKYTVNSGIGEDAARELWCVRDHRTADIIGCYERLKELYTGRRFKLKAGMDARFLQIFDIIDLDYNWLYDSTPVEHVDAVCQIRALELGLSEFYLECWARSANYYVYSEHASYPTNSEVDDDLPDYSNTPPDAPTSLTKASEGTRQGTDGTTYAYVTLTAVEPSVNSEYLEFGWKEKSADNYQWTSGSDTNDDGTWNGSIEGLIPGQYYYFAARAVNFFGIKGEIAEITSSTTGYLMPGDTTAPETPSSLVCTAGTGKSLNLNWSDNIENDLAGYGVYIHTANVPASATKLDGLALASNKTIGNTSAYTLAYGSTYYVWVTAIDASGNESAKSLEAHATLTQLQTTDYGDTTVTAGKMSVTTLSAITGNVGTLTAGIIKSSDYPTTPGFQLDLTNATITVTKASGLVIDSTGGVEIQADGSNQANLTFSGSTTDVTLTFTDGDLDSFAISASVDDVSLHFVDWSYIYLFSTNFTAIVAGSSQYRFSSTAFYPTSDTLQIGDSGSPWGDVYLNAGSSWWKFANVTDGNEYLQLWKGTTQKFAFESAADSGDRGTVWTGDLIYEGSLQNTGWTKDFSKVDKFEVLQSLVEAYTAHDGSLLHPILQKKITDRKYTQDEHGIVGLVEEKEKIGKSLDDVVQLIVECLHNHILTHK